MKWVAILLIVLMSGGMAFGGAMDGDVSIFMGGMSWQAAFYAMIDPLLGLAISYMQLVWFRKRWNGPAAKLTVGLSANAFLVYILHALFVTYFAFALRDFAWHPFVKFISVGCAAFILSYIAASLIRQIPGVKKVV